MSSVVQFTLESLRDLDGGKASIAFENHIRRAAADCSDRPGDTKARTVTLEVSVVPVMEPGGDCTEVNVTIKAKSTVPPHRSKPYSMGLRRNGVVVFAPDSPDNINQTTFINEDESR